MTEYSEESAKEELRKIKKKQKTRSNIFITVVVLFIVVWLLSQDYSTQSESSSSVTTPTATIDTSWVPSGYNSWSDNPNVAYRWLEDDEYNCIGDSCWGIMVIAKNGCDTSLYAEISILDKSEVQVGYTNDSVSSALPMQKSKLIFDSFEDSARKARLSKISCY